MSSGNCARASVNMPMERLESFNMGRIPAGTVTHRRNADPTPQINPAPGLVARGAKNRTKASPKKLPSKTPCAGDVVSSALRKAPPTAPRPNPSRGSIQTEPATPATSCALIEDSDADIIRTPSQGLYRRASPVGLLLKIDGLDDISREEKFDSPVHQHTDFPLYPWQFRQVDAAPHQPSQQP